MNYLYLGITFYIASIASTATVYYLSVLSQKRAYNAKIAKLEEWASKVQEASGRGAAEITE